MAFPEDRARSHDETLEETPNPAGRSATRNRSPTARDRPSLEGCRPRPERSSPPSERSLLRSSATAYGANASFGNRAESQRRIFALDGHGAFRYTARLRRVAERQTRRSQNRYRKVCGFESHPGHHFFAGNRTAINSPNNRRCYFSHPSFSLPGARYAPMRPAPMPQPHQVGRRWPYGASGVRERCTRASPMSGNRKRCGRKRRSSRPEFRQGSESL